MKCKIGIETRGLSVGLWDILPLMASIVLEYSIARNITMVLFSVRFSQLIDKCWIISCRCQI
jgi:hypothetical protein